MGLYSRALRHVDNKDFRRTHQHRVNEQEILRAEERKKRIVEEREIKKIKKLSAPFKYNWREKLNEGMTSSGVFFATLPATGDANLTYPSWNALAGYNYNISGGTATITNSGVEGPESGISASFDTSLYDTLVIDVGFSGDTILGVFYSGSADPLLITTNSGTYNIKVPQSKNQALLFLSATLSVGTVNISNLRFQRRTPMNVFVSLDNPEASAFMRTSPMMSKLSPQERQQKLKEMLQASDEYVMKIFGGEFPGTGAAAPGEYDPFAQPEAGKAGDTPGVEISQASPAMPSYVRDSIMRQYGKPGYGRFTPEDQMNIIKWQQKLKQADISYQDTQVAWNTPVLPTGPSTPVKYDKFMKQYVPSGRDGFPGNYAPGYLPTASNNKKQSMVASYEPQGQIITEKKKLKSPEEVLNKIPGYYDGKPAPLGFPETPPPKMVNGMHPDLVDGKAVSNRFNRLDPESAKAMPPTGNPHIDKKVKAARKKPK